MRKTMITMIALSLLMLSVPPSRAAAQETTKDSEVQPKPADCYKVEFTVNELDHGKTINSRTYSIQVAPGGNDMKRLRVGSRVPIATGPNSLQYQYMDVGMNIDCRVMPFRNGGVIVLANVDYSSLGGEPAREAQNPVVRTVRSEIQAIVPLAKPTVVAEMDDVASTHRFQFEVKVTKTFE